MLLFISACVVLIVVAVLIDSAILTWFTKLFKIENATFKKSLLILLFSGVISFIVKILFGIINLGIISNIFVTIVAFLAFYFLLNKYYQVSWKKSLGLYIAYSAAILILGLVIIIPIRMFIVQPFFVQGATMEPNFHDGQYTLIKIYDKDYKRGDVIIHKYPKNLSQFFIKRIIGLPGEKIEIKDGVVSVNEKTLDESLYLIKNMVTKGDENVVLANNEYFVMGDNRESSYDSRSFGPVKKDLIVGKYWLTLLK